MNESAGDQPGAEMIARLHDRKAFLKLLGAAGSRRRRGCERATGAAEGAVSTSLQPTDFSFEVRERFRPFHLLAKNFVQLDDSFEHQTVGNYTILRPGSARGGRRRRPGAKRQAAFRRAG